LELPDPTVYVLKPLVALDVLWGSLLLDCGSDRSKSKPPSLLLRVVTVVCGPRSVFFWITSSTSLSLKPSRSRSRSRVLLRVAKAEMLEERLGSDDRFFDDFEEGLCVEIQPLTLLRGPPSSLGKSGRMVGAQAQILEWSCQRRIPTLR